MNDALFFLHIFLVVGFLFAALRLGAAALAAGVAIQAVLANLFVLKQIELFGLSVTCSDVFAIGSLLSLNLLQEHFGKGEALRAVKVSLGSLLFFAVMAQVHLLYIPSEADRTHEAFILLFSAAPRLVAASLFCFFVVQRLDIALFARLQRAFKGERLSLRISISLLITQLVDTVLFSFLGLYGLVASLPDLILMSCAAKGLVIAFSAPLTVFSKRFVRHGVSV